MKQSITAVHIERVRRLYNDHVHQQFLPKATPFSRPDNQRSSASVALTSWFVNLHHKVCKGLILVSSTNFTLINNFRKPTFDQTFFHWPLQMKFVGICSPWDATSTVRDSFWSAMILSGFVTFMPRIVSSMGKMKLYLIGGNKCPPVISVPPRIFEIIFIIFWTKKMQNV